MGRRIEAGERDREIPREIIEQHYQGRKALGTDKYRRMRKDEREEVYVEKKKKIPLHCF